MGGRTPDCRRRNVVAVAGGPRALQFSGYRSSARRRPVAGPDHGQRPRGRHGRRRAVVGQDESDMRAEGLHGFNRHECRSERGRVASGAVRRRFGPEGWRRGRPPASCRPARNRRDAGRTIASCSAGERPRSHPRRGARREKGEPLLDHEVGWPCRRSGHLGQVGAALGPEVAKHAQASRGVCCRSRPSGKQRSDLAAQQVVHRGRAAGVGDVLPGDPASWNSMATSRCGSVPVPGEPMLASRGGRSHAMKSASVFTAEAPPAHRETQRRLGGQRHRLQIGVRRSRGRRGTGRRWRSPLGSNSVEPSAGAPSARRR